MKFNLLNIKIIYLLSQILIYIVICQNCFDPFENDIKHDWSFYLSTRADDSTKKVHYFHSDSTEVKIVEATIEFYKDILNKIVEDVDYQIYTFSDEGNGVKAHHKSVVALKKDGTGIFISHSFSSLHRHFEPDVSMASNAIKLVQSQHMFCMSIKSKEDLETLKQIFEIIKPNFKKVRTDKEKSPAQFITTFNTNPNIDCLEEKEKRSWPKPPIPPEWNLLKNTKHLLDPALRDPKCLIESKIGIFNFFAVPLMQTQFQVMKAGGMASVEYFGVDAWWMIARRLQEKFLVTTHKDKELDYGSIYHEDVYLINFIWKYSDEVDSTHEKLAISYKDGSTTICIGDGNRHYTQYKRAGLYFCFDNVILHKHLKSRAKLFLKEEYLILDKTTDELYLDFLKGKTEDNKLSLQESKRKFFFKVDSSAKVVNEKKREIDTEEEVSSGEEEKVKKKFKTKPPVNMVKITKEVEDAIALFEKDGTLNDLMEKYQSSASKTKLLFNEKTNVSPKRFLCHLTQGCSKTFQSNRNSDLIKHMKCEGCGLFASAPLEYFYGNGKLDIKTANEKTKYILVYMHLHKKNKDKVK
ncbi:hypothetical protein DLAC_07191 [Tieghemostelium lacteum]|uniref:Uncharacterized protein n=1 Tax=Tieghemostelium lacteum TaxID=361077 RepID=A0A151ZDG9_TIELA|nr:hypothetical protein DLAC_07191 [Tieghemostelium lacteum]|eukprot:KYQ91950.1 hypothetical protein DLAC_07191 [Tieghemostelium lacteum]